jgi:hypothetical protein
VASGFHPAGNDDVHPALLQRYRLLGCGGGAKHLDAAAVGFLHYLGCRDAEHKADDGGPGFQRGLHLLAIVGKVPRRHLRQWHAELLEVGPEDVHKAVEVGLRHHRGLAARGDPEVEGEGPGRGGAKVRRRTLDRGAVVTVEAVGTQPAAVAHCCGELHGGDAAKGAKDHGNPDPQKLGDPVASGSGAVLRSHVGLLAAKSGWCALQSCRSNHLSQVTGTQSAGAHVSPSPARSSSGSSRGSCPSCR